MTLVRQVSTATHSRGVAAQVRGRVAPDGRSPSATNSDTTSNSDWRSQSPTAASRWVPLAPRTKSERAVRASRSKCRGSARRRSAGPVLAPRCITGSKLPHCARRSTHDAAAHATRHFSIQLHLCHACTWRNELTEKVECVGREVHPAAMTSTHGFKKLQRVEIDGAARFLTFSCHQQRRIFTLPERCSAFTRAITNYAASGKIELHAWVLMPDHVHLLLTPLEQSLWGSLSLFKESVARRLIRIAGDFGPVWRPGGGYDRTIVTCGEFREKRDYIHRNPLKAGFVPRLDVWRWSSWPDLHGTIRSDMPILAPMNPARLATAKVRWLERQHRFKGCVGR